MSNLAWTADAQISTDSLSPQQPLQGQGAVGTGDEEGMVAGGDVKCRAEQGGRDGE